MQDADDEQLLPIIARLRANFCGTATQRGAALAPPWSRHFHADGHWHFCHADGGPSRWEGPTSALAPTTAPGRAAGDNQPEGSVKCLPCGIVIGEA